MNYNTLNYNYIKLMMQAEQATSRQDALHCIQCATALKEAMAAINQYTSSKDKG
jgi:hypothetical protein